MFRQLDLKGKTKDDTKLDTVHQNTITKVRVYERALGRLTKFSSKFNTFEFDAMLTCHIS
jgi:actin related protein 2/3 complex subunit 1A/1B